MIYKEEVYKEDLYYAHIYNSSWKQSFAFTYVAGATVNITPVLTATIPFGTNIKIYAGEVSGALEEIENGIESPVLFTNAVSGSVNLYFELILSSNTKGITPEVSNLDLTIRQETSLYTAAVQVLNDSKIDTLVDYVIDTDLQKYLIPYLFMEPMTHREAMAKIGEACGGVTYQNRYGVIQVEASDYLSRNCTSVLETIGEDKIYDINSPLAAVKNKIQITSFPYVIQTTQTVWSTIGKSIDIGSNNITVKFKDDEIALSSAASISSTPSGATILSSTFYSYGADLVVNGTVDGQTADITITGKPLKVTGTIISEKIDSASTRNNGIKTLAITDNQFIQSSAVADLLAENILSIYANAQRDVTVNWRGDPSYELGDCIKIVDTDYNILTQEFNFDGILTSNMQLRRS